VCAADAIAGQEGSVIQEKDGAHMRPKAGQANHFYVSVNPCGWKFVFAFDEYFRLMGLME
jgi:hypothetical protein